MDTQDKRVFRFGPFEADLGNRQLFKNGLTVYLTGQPFDVLALLLKNPGNLVTREQLRTRLWPAGTVVEFDHGIHVAVTKLREALGDDTQRPRFIATVPRHGYRFIAPVSPLSTPALDRFTAPVPTLGSAALEHTAVHPQPAQASATDHAPERSGLKDQSGREASTPNTRANTVRSLDPRLPAVITGIALVLIYVAVERYSTSRHPAAVQPVTRPNQEALAPAVESAAAARFNLPPQSIAVLPLANESGDPSQQYFSDGLSEDLITALSQFPGLKVIGRTSSFQFRDSKEDSRTIGTKLGVAHLLEGSVRRSGRLVRVSATLIDTADGSTQWSARYDRPYKDLFALQDEITRAVAGALRAKLLPGDSAAAQSERPPSGSLEAYNALLQGQFYLSRRTEADYRKAIEYYTQATQLDPRYAFAWSALSRAWTGLGTNFLARALVQEPFAKARAAANRALTLSPELAAAHIARGTVLCCADLDWHGAEAEFRRALALAPNDAEAKVAVGHQLATFGDVESAIELTRQALADEPLRADWHRWLAIYFRGLNRLDDAEGAIHRAIELQPSAGLSHHTLTVIEVMRGNAQAALAAAQQEPPGMWQDSALSLALQISGDRSAADAALRTVIERDANSLPYQIARVYALRNDAKQTFEWLERTWANRDSDVGHLLFDPFIRRYKDDPRFAAFCHKIGLTAPGEASARKSP